MRPVKFCMAWIAVKEIPTFKQLGKLRLCDVENLQTRKSYKIQKYFSAVQI